jgi:hypothetical protein
MRTFPYHLISRAYTVGTPTWRTLESGVVTMQLGNAVLRARDELGQGIYAIDLRLDCLPQADAALLNVFRESTKRGVTPFYWQDPLLGPLATSRWQTWTCRFDPATPPRIVSRGAGRHYYDADITLLAAVPTVATAMLVARWPMDDGGYVLEAGADEALEVGSREFLSLGGGTAVVDSTGNGHDGVATRDTAAMAAAGVVGGALTCNGTTDYIQVPDAAALRLTTGGTIMAWIKPSSLGESDGGRIADKTTWYFALSAGNRLAFKLSTEVAETFSTASAITLNAWQHVTIVFDDQGRRLYVDAVDVTENGGSRTALPISGTGVLRLGNRATATDRAFAGSLDDVRIYGRPLSRWEIAEICNGGAGAVEDIVP